MKKRKICILMVLSILLFSYYEIYISYNKITENNYTIESRKINENINFIMISDLHDNELGKNNEDLINKIDSFEPEIIIVAGDMLNEYSSNSKIVINVMKSLRYKGYKIFYSLGNTEKDYIKKGTSDLLSELESIGVTVLEKEYKDIKVNNNYIRIGGMYDYAFALNGEREVCKGNMEDGMYDFLSDFQNTSKYKIMICHRPDSFVLWDASKYWDIDLVVSGHNHGGQVVLPFIGGLYGGDQGWFPKYDKGIFDLNKIKILITSGLGSGKQKLPRFNNPPEIVNLYLSK